MISAPGFTVFSVRDSHGCKHVRVSMTCWADIHSLSLFPPRAKTVGPESENTTFSCVRFYPLPPSLAVSGLVFTGCFICLIYVPLSRLLRGRRLQQPHGRPARLNEVSYQ